MVSITLSIPKGIKKEMDLFPEINWSAVARIAIKQKLTVLQEMNKLLAKSELTDKDALAFGKQISRKLAKKYKDA